MIRKQIYCCRERQKSPETCDLNQLRLWDMRINPFFRFLISAIESSSQLVLAACSSAISVQSKTCHKHVQTITLVITRKYCGFKKDQEKNYRSGFIEFVNPFIACCSSLLEKELWAKLLWWALECLACFECSSIAPAFPTPWAMCTQGSPLHGCQVVTLIHSCFLMFFVRELTRKTIILSISVAVSVFP